MIASQVRRCTDFTPCCGRDDETMITIILICPGVCPAGRLRVSLGRPPNGCGRRWRRTVTYDGGGKTGLRFSRNAVAPSTMSALPTACMSMPRPVENESRAKFHQTFELIFAISR